MHRQYTRKEILIVEECILLRLYTIKHDNHVASKVTWLSCFIEKRWCGNNAHQYWKIGGNRTTCGYSQLCKRQKNTDWNPRPVWVQYDHSVITRILFSEPRVEYKYPYIWLTDYANISSNFKWMRGTAGPPQWSSGQSAWLQIRRPGFDSRHYQIFRGKKGKQ
jgi:hypothetical protein